MTLPSSRRLGLYGSLLSLAFAAGCAGDGASGKLDSNDSNAQGTGDGASDGTGDGSGGAGDGADGTGDGAAGDGSDGAGDGSGDGSGDVPAPAPGPTTYFRIDDLLLLKPDVYGSISSFSVKVTGQVNTALDRSLNNDDGPGGTPDGYLDLSAVLRFDDFAPMQDGSAALGAARCTYPVADTTCEADARVPFTEYDYMAHATGTCLEAEGVTVDAPCAVNAPQDLSFDLGTLGTVPLKAAQMAGAWAEDPNDGIVLGLVRGFLTEAAAQQTKVPDGVPALAAAIGIKAGMSLSELLKVSEQTTLDDEKGWWFTARFSATPVHFVE